jgi:hypothetical protein
MTVLESTRGMHESDVRYVIEKIGQFDSRLDSLEKGQQSMDEKLDTLVERDALFRGFVSGTVKIAAGLCAISGIIAAWWAKMPPMGGGPH